MTKVAILGAGRVGTALGRRLRASGDTVLYGVRHPREAPVEGARTEAPGAAVAQADFVFLAVPAASAIEALRSAGDVSGKIVVDCTNPLSWSEGPVWAPPAEGSVTQALAASFPEARVVKGFNHFGAEIQNDPATASGAADAFFASDDAQAKRRVMELAARMGFRSRDAGPLRNAGLLENLAVLWIHLATVGGAGREFTFRMEGRP